MASTINVALMSVELKVHKVVKVHRVRMDYSALKDLKDRKATADKTDSKVHKAIRVRKDQVAQVI
jgi:hypothetical protein